MIASTPVERIGQILVGAGYQVCSLPLVVGGIRFDIAAAFLGTSRSQELIVVADTAFDTEQKILRNIQAIARALDVAESTRPLTVIIAGPRPTAGTMVALSRVSRVLPVGVSDGRSLDATLFNWLAVLLPIDVPKAAQVLEDPMAGLINSEFGASAISDSLMKRVHDGSPAVESHFYELLEAALTEPEIDDAT